MTRTVLVVDDSETIRRMLRWILTPLGLRVLEAENGARALEVLDRDAVDLVVADLNMPVMDGLELLRSIRALPARALLPVLMLTTEDREADIQRALQAGANLYLTKPSTPRVIRYKVLALLGGADA
jgi:two-component system chemotaxis response regulator CheY